MAGTSIPFQVVIFTKHHSISGVISLRDQRLSDFLNDRNEKYIMLRNAVIARLENPARVIERIPVSILPKSGIVIAFEPPQKPILPARFINNPKQKYTVFVVLEGMEVHGEVYMQGSFAPLRILTDAGDSFLPCTHASISIEGNPTFLLQKEAGVINTQHIRLIGEVENHNPIEPTQQLPNGE